MEKREKKGGGLQGRRWEVARRWIVRVCTRVCVCVCVCVCTAGCHLFICGARSHKRGSAEDGGTPRPKKKPGDRDYDPYDFDSDDEGG